MHRFDRASIFTDLVLLALLAVLCVGGCGYRSQLPSAANPRPGAPADATLGGHGDARPAIRISVLALRNDSPEPWLDRIVTAAMRRELDSRGGFDFVNDPTRADLVVRGRIRGLDTRSQSFSRFVSALEYGVTLQLDLEVLLGSGDVVRLDSGMLSESDVYLASADIEVTRTNRLEVLRHLSDLLASRVADSIELIESPIPEESKTAEERAGGSG